MTKRECTPQVRAANRALTVICAARCILPATKGSGSPQVNKPKPSLKPKLKPFQTRQRALCTAMASMVAAFPFAIHFVFIFEHSFVQIKPTIYRGAA